MLCVHTTSKRHLLVQTRILKEFSVARVVIVSDPFFYVADVELSRLDDRLGVVFIFSSKVEVVSAFGYNHGGDRRRDVAQHSSARPRVQQSVAENDIASGRNLLSSVFQNGEFGVCLFHSPLFVTIFRIRVEIPGAVLEHVVVGGAHRHDHFGASLEIPRVLPQSRRSFVDDVTFGGLSVIRVDLQSCPYSRKQRFVIHSLTFCHFVTKTPDRVGRQRRQETRGVGIVHHRHVDHNLREPIDQSVDIALCFERRTQFPLSTQPSLAGIVRCDVSENQHFTCTSRLLKTDSPDNFPRAAQGDAAVVVECSLVDVRDDPVEVLARSETLELPNGGGRRDGPHDRRGEFHSQPGRQHSAVRPPERHHGHFVGVGRAGPRGLEVVDQVDVISEGLVGRQVPQTSGVGVRLVPEGQRLSVVPVFGEDQQRVELGGDVKHESRVFGEVFNGALISSVKKDRSVIHPKAVVDQVLQLKGGVVREAEIGRRIGVGDRSNLPEVVDGNFEVFRRVIVGQNLSAKQQYRCQLHFGG
jgi:hypothetical protein